jgi:hypothetical protein
MRSVPAVQLLATYFYLFPRLSTTKIKKGTKDPWGGGFRDASFIDKRRMGGKEHKKMPYCTEIMTVKKAP